MIVLYSINVCINNLRPLLSKSPLLCCNPAILTARTHHRSVSCTVMTGPGIRAIKLTRTASISDSSKFLIFGCQRYSGASQNSLNIGFPKFFPLLEVVDESEKFLYFSRKLGNASLNSAGAAGWGFWGCGPAKYMLNTKRDTMMSLLSHQVAICVCQ